MINALISGTAAFIVTLIIGLPIVAYLRQAKAGKSISEDQPASHQVKAGTPTFGGIVIWVPTLLITASGLSVQWWENRSILLPVGMIVVTGAAGFVDDLGTLQIRVVRGGLTWRFKMLFLAVVAAVAAWVLYDLVEVESINIPWKGSYELGYWYLGIAFLTIIATSAAVAVSDGLDALTGGTTLVAFIAYGVIAFIQGQDFVATFCLIIAGANLGFLWYNAHPAQIFMGDTGALALGSGLATVSLMTGHWLLLPLIGFVFVAEAMSNIIQIGYFKLSGGKRVFKRAPLHHHFEEIGWAETQVVTRFWVVAIAASMLGVALALAVPE
ncbi:MAG: phospho-N-acetylmuramoyl-pentapeptide-transferase [Dehalococcoidia bacterium]